MHINNLLKYILLIFITFILSKYFLFLESIFIFILYAFFYKNRYFILVISNLLFLNIGINVVFKNIIFFLMFEILLIILIRGTINTKGKYRIFLLTFFLYLVLINVFEPMVYNYNRLLESIYLYFSCVVIFKVSIIIKKIIKGSDLIE